jgi:Na+-driven multidrug efflux pump
MRIAFGYLFSAVLHFGVIGIWFGMYLDWVFRSVMFMIRAKGEVWLQKSVV